MKILLNTVVWTLGILMAFGFAIVPFLAEIAHAQSQSIPTISPFRYYGSGTGRIGTVATTSKVVIGSTTTTTNSYLETPSLTLRALLNQNCLGTDSLGVVISGTCGGGEISTTTVRGMFSAIVPIDYDSSTGIFSVSSGYNIPLTSSSTNWNDFYDVPSTRITAGTNLSWAGNTLNATGDGSSQWTDATTYIYPTGGKYASAPYFVGTSTTAYSTFYNASSTNFATTNATTTGLVASTFKALTSAGLVLSSNSGTQVADFGAGGGSNATFFGGVNIDGATRLATSLNGCVTATAGVISASGSCGGSGASNWVLVNGVLTPSTTVGIGVFASSTIGGGTGATGLTVSGNSTTTGSSYVAGTLGVGTSTPAATFHVSGPKRTQLYLDASSESGVHKIVSIQSPDDNSVEFGAGAGTGSTGTKIKLNGNTYAAASGTISFITNSTERATLNSTGYFGIGDTSPSSLLTVGAGDLFTVNSSGGFNAVSGTSTNLYATTFGVNSEYFTDLTGTGLVNTAGVLGCATAGAGTFGCLSSTDWNTFNGKESVLTFSTGLTRTANNIAPTSGYNIPLTASTTNWNSFFDTPSTRITAGTGLSWAGNTLNATGGAGGSSNWILLNGALAPSTTVGVRVSASSTIGDGTATGGLTISGGATTTGDAYFGGNVGIGTTTPSSLLSIASPLYDYTRPLFNVSTSTGEEGQIMQIFSTTTLGSNGHGTNKIYGGRIVIGGMPSLYKNTGSLSTLFTNGRQESSFFHFRASAQNFAVGIAASSNAAYGDSAYLEDGAAGATSAANLPGGWGAESLRAITFSNASADSGVGLWFVTSNVMLLSSSTPSIEGIIKTGTASTSQYFGFVNINPSGSNYEVPPTYGAYFTSVSTTPNWRFVVKVNDVETTNVDTGVPSTTSMFGKIVSNATDIYAYTATDASPLNLINITTMVPDLADQPLSAGIYFARRSLGSVGVTLYLSYMEMYLRKPYMKVDY